MSERLRTIYTYLVDNRKHELQGWYDEYNVLTNDVQLIKKELDAGKLINDVEVYKATSYNNSKTKTPYEDFLKKFLYDKSNGISSRGESILSNENLIRFINDKRNFEEVIENLIKNPNKETNKALVDYWKNFINRNNPVLTNRALAACTLTVSSTVAEVKFDQVFDWFQKNDLISKYTGGSDSWYDKNVFLMKELKAGLHDVKNIDDYWISLFVWEAFVNLSSPFTLKKQVVKYGAPGTGKTYKAKEVSKLQFDVWKAENKIKNNFIFSDAMEFIQFHPSYSYEDFIEGLRPVLVGEEKQEVHLKLVNGIFKELCKKAARWESDIYNSKLEKKIEDIILEDIHRIKEELNEEYWEYVFLIEDRKKRLLDVLPPYFMVIDEINRAELSRVFGELMFSLEYRGTQNSIKTQYAQLNTSETAMIKKGNSFQFFIPHNLYIIATMNTIDRSVESMDFAMRRRFRWEEVLPDTTLLKYHLIIINKDWQDLAESLEKLNEAIKNEVLLGKDYCIGHSYFWDLKYSQKLSLSQVRKLIWEDSIHSLLEEYLRGTGREELIKHFAKEFGIN